MYGFLRSIIRRRAPSTPMQVKPVLAEGAGFRRPVAVIPSAMMATDVAGTVVAVAASADGAAGTRLRRDPDAALCLLVAGAAGGDAQAAASLALLADLLPARIVPADLAYAVARVQGLYREGATAPRGFAAMSVSGTHILWAGAGAVRAWMMDADGPREIGGHLAGTAAGLSGRPRLIMPVALEGPVVIGPCSLWEHLHPAAALMAAYRQPSDPARAVLAALAERPPPLESGRCPVIAIVPASHRAGGDMRA